MQAPSSYTMASFAVEEEVKVAKQVEFDAVVGQLMEEGALLEDAVSETLEILEEDGQGLDYLYVYRNESEQRDKDKILKNCQTVEKCGRGEETTVNCTFSFQGLQQAFNDADQLKSKHSWRLAEARGIVVSLVKLLAVKEEEEKDRKSDDSDDSDEEEDEILFMVEVLRMLLMIAEEGSIQARLRAPEKAFSLDEESMNIVLARLDESSDELRVAKPLAQFIKILISQGTNKTLFVDGGGVSNLELTAKMHKKNQELINLCTAAVTMCNNDVELSG